MKRLACACAPLFLMLATACQSAPATTASTTASEPVKTVTADADLVCRSMKVKTPEAWVQYDTYTNQNAKEATDKVQRTNTGSSMGGT